MRKRPVVIVAVIALISVVVYLVSRPPEEQISLRTRSRHHTALAGRIPTLGYQWHPDGYLIVERHNKGSREVCRIDPESGSAKLLFRYAPKGNGQGEDDAGALSPDGRWRITTMQKEYIVCSM